MHRSLGFKRHAPALQAGWWGGPEEGAETKAERVQRQTSSCSGQAQLTGAGRDVLFFSAGEVTRPRASLVPSSGAGPQ